VVEGVLVGGLSVSHVMLASLQMQLVLTSGDVIPLEREFRCVDD
jgi:hypothetical protein